MLFLLTSFRPLISYHRRKHFPDDPLQDNIALHSLFTYWVFFSVTLFPNLLFHVRMHVFMQACIICIRQAFLPTDISESLKQGICLLYLHRTLCRRMHIWPPQTDMKSMKVYSGSEKVYSDRDRSQQCTFVLQWLLLIKKSKEEGKKKYPCRTKPTELMSAVYGVLKCFRHLSKSCKFRSSLYLSNPVRHKLLLCLSSRQGNWFTERLSKSFVQWIRVGGNGACV